ncbi:hypothetical protein RB623_22570, partial [Mesorhizobium sp. LHD-90]|uniref:hypothetical protein n=1 Tax=Mesorhizobium sp. LHD-90 TaxID=3071414 RepID=UPI0027E1DB11
SRKTAMICSSVNRFLFISPSFKQGPDSNLNWRKLPGAGQRSPNVMSDVVWPTVLPRRPG